MNLRTSRHDAEICRSHETRRWEHFRGNYWIYKEINIWVIRRLLSNLKCNRIPTKLKAPLVINNFFDWLVGKRGVPWGCELWKVVPSQQLFSPLNIVFHFLGDISIVLNLNTHPDASTVSWLRLDVSGRGCTSRRTCRANCFVKFVKFL